VSDTTRQPFRPGLPVWITAEAVADTRAVFEPMHKRPLSDDDVVEILLNVGNLFENLSEPPATSQH